MEGVTESTWEFISMAHRTSSAAALRTRMRAPPGVVPRVPRVFPESPRGLPRKRVVPSSQRFQRLHYSCPAEGSWAAAWRLRAVTFVAKAIQSIAVLLVENEHAGIEL